MDDAMSRRDRRADGPEDALNAPFRRLKTLMHRVPPASVRRPPQRALRQKAVPPEEHEDDEALFRAATEGVARISPEARNLVPGRAPTPPGASSAEREQLEVLAELSDLVSGSGHFELSDTDEHVEGWVMGLDPRVVQRLRGGEFACQAHLDLHGLTVEEARAEVRGFILRALRGGYRCVLVIHGRGRNSKDRRPILKDALKGWLSRGELAQVVLAFATARPCDGGAGATYVLLRRQRRRKKPFQTLDGAKS
jgi:DNA-nicking Smr family endonuclease